MFLLYKVSLFLAQGKDTEAHLPIWSGSANLLASMICHYISYAIFFSFWRFLQAVWVHKISLQWPSHHASKVSVWMIIYQTRKKTYSQKSLVSFYNFSDRHPHFCFSKRKLKFEDIKKSTKYQKIIKWKEWYLIAVLPV